jgi:3-oxoacyl-[acyl-carrier protein] reductase
MGRDLLKGRVAVVTGASQGIGEGIAREYADEGATVALVARNADNLDRIEAEIKAGGGEARAYPLDITDHERYRKVIDDVVSRWGHLDILVNNAMAVWYATILEEEDSVEHWRRTMAVNLEATWYGSKLAAPYMVKQKWGRIISISSVQALTPSGDCGAYCTTKGGMISITKSMAVELAPHNILCNVIAPGFIRTAASFVDGVDETTTDWFLNYYIGMRKVPLARTGHPTDVAGAAIFLASDYCRYITGHVLYVDGGLTSTF